MALVLAVALVEVFLPTFNDLVGRRLSTDYISNPTMLAGLAGVGVFVSIVAGSYPAFYLSSFSPASVLKGAPRARPARRLAD